MAAQESRKRTNISPKLLFASAPSHFQLETPKWTFLRPVSKDLPSEPGRVSRCWLQPRLSPPPRSHHVNSIRDGSSLANNFELRAVSRVYMYICIPCTRIICTRVCVRMCTYVRRSLVPVQRSKPTNPLPRGQQGDARIHFFFFPSSLRFPFADLLFGLLSHFDRSRNSEIFRFHSIRGQCI